MIRPPNADEIGRLQEIEVAAGRSFIDVGLPEVASDEPLPAATLDAFRLAGRAWVVDVDGTVAAYVVVDVIDGHAHIEQVSTDPAFRGERLGRRLLDHVAGWARERGDREVTLTTFRDVPWNAPYYEACGYRILADAERGPELVVLMEQEAAHGLDPARRVAMTVNVGSEAG